MNDEIVPNVPKDHQDQWQDAANSWRLPYWDWAADPDVPAVVRQRDLSIMGFDNKTQESITNPLYQFTTGAISTFKEAGQVPLFNDRSSFGQWAIFNDPPVSSAPDTIR